MNDALNEARTLLRNVNPKDETTFTPVIVPDHSGYTVMVSDNVFHDQPPLIDTISNEDLSKLYGYAVRCSNCDDAFADFEGPLMSINGCRLKDIFCDLYFALGELDGDGVTRIMDF